MEKILLTITFIIFGIIILGLAILAAFLCCLLIFETASFIKDSFCERRIEKLEYQKEQYKKLEDNLKTLENSHNILNENHKKLFNK